MSGSKPTHDVSFLQFVVFFAQIRLTRFLMTRNTNFNRYSLYGEENAKIAPEFLHIESISARSSRYEWTISAHSHPGIFQIILLECGGGRLTADDVSIVLSPENLIVIPSGSVHAFAFADDAEGWVLSIASALFGTLTDGNRFPRRKLMTSSATATALSLEQASARRISWILREIEMEVRDGGAVRISDQMLAILALLLAVIEERMTPLAHSPRLPAGTDARREKLVQRFSNLVEQHFQDRWQVTRYAEALSTSAPTLSRACHVALGISPGDFILDRIQLEAMRALTYSAASVSRISDELGFVDPAHFAHFFKSRTGLTASRFRSEKTWLSGQS